MVDRRIPGYAPLRDRTFLVSRAEGEPVVLKAVLPPRGANYVEIPEMDAATRDGFEDLVRRLDEKLTDRSTTTG